jgi:hypothetical protein
MSGELAQPGNPICVRISMDGKNRAVDNIYIERFWRTLKYQEVYTKEYATPREARNEIRKFIHKYNHERPHQSLRDHTPAEIYLMGMKPDSYLFSAKYIYRKGDCLATKTPRGKEQGKPLRSSPLAYGRSPLPLLQKRN